MDRAPDGLDVTASRTGDRVYLHVVDTRRERPADANLSVAGMKIMAGQVFEMAAAPGTR